MEFQIPKALLPAWQSRNAAVNKLRSVATHASVLREQVYKRLEEVLEAVRAADEVVGVPGGLPIDPTEARGILDRAVTRLGAIDKSYVQIERAMTIARQKTQHLISDPSRAHADFERGEVDARIDWALSKALDRLERDVALLEANLRAIDEVMDELATLLPSA